MKKRFHAPTLRRFHAPPLLTLLRALRISAVKSPFVSFRALLWPLLRTLPRFHALTLLTLLTLSTTACQVLTYTTPTGEHFTRSSLGSTTSLTSLSLVTDTNGLRRVELRGYKNDSSQALGIITESAVKGAIQALK